MALNPDKTQQVKNNRLIIAVWENKETKEKRANIEKILLSGADINAPSANLKNNTALHIAVKKADIDIIKLLLDNGADVTQTNSLDENVLDVAKTLTHGAREEIVALLEARMNIQNLFVEELEEADSEEKLSVNDVNNQEVKYFLMQDRNTGVRGHLYETKMLGLVLLRAENDKDIENYYLASNIAGIGVFDDIGFKYNVKGREKSIRIFLQAKHRDLPKKGRLTLEDIMKPDGDLSLANCFDSFLQIKKKFDPKSGDPMFGESYENVEFNFIIYTSGEASFNRKLIGKNERSPKIHKLIYTGEQKSIFQFNYNDDDIYYITRDVQRMRIKQLAHNFIKFILADKDKYKDMMEDDLIKKYHCVLEQTAVRLCKVEKNYIEAVFRPELLSTTDYFNLVLKEELCKVIIERCCNKPTKIKESIVNEFKKLPKEPSSAALSVFIGTVITYDAKNNKLKVLDNVSKRGLKSNEIKLLNEHVKQIQANPTVIADAVMKAGERQLLSTKFKLPPSFGNIDIFMKDSRISYIVSMFKDLFEINKDLGEIVINETDLGKNPMPNSKSTLTEGFIGHNGGISSAVGNMLLYNENKSTLKFNTMRPQYEKADKLLGELEKVLPEGKTLDDYVIKVNTYNFARATFSNDVYDNALAKCFLNRLWFYCNQGREDEVAKSLKIEIEKYYNEQNGRMPFRFRTHIDSIFSKFHREIQNWWTVSSDNSLASYLTRDSDIFRIAQEGVDSPLLTLHHEMYLTKLKKLGIGFTNSSVEKLGIDAYPNRIVNIQTVNDMLSAIKIYQLLQNQNNYNFIDLSYMLSLPPEDRNVILEELKVTSMETLIIICGPIKTDTSINENLNQVIKEFKENKVIIISNVEDSSKLLISDKYSIIKDDFNDFEHLDEISRLKIVGETEVTFQDEEICLEELVDDYMMEKINAKMLTNIINNVHIQIGRKLMTKNYEEIKDCYVPRRLIKDDSEESYPVNCLEDIEDKVVVIVTKHGMGKSTLMTHAALESKKAIPNRWIVRINLADFENDFYALAKRRTIIDKPHAVKLLSMEALKHINRKMDFELIEEDGTVSLSTRFPNTLDSMALFELELFLHYYNERKITFLLYGFDHVCPPFNDLAIELLESIQAFNIPMWIASHAVEIPKQILEKQFGVSYKLQIIDQTDQLGFFHKFCKTNIQLEKINTEVCSNIVNFFEFMLGNHNLHNKQDRMTTPWISMPLHMLYLMGIQFFQTEFNNISFEHVKKVLKQYVNIDLNRGSSLGSFMEESPEVQQAVELAGTPLYMYVAANYFQCKINGKFKIEPDVPELRKKWDLWRDTLHLYEQFLQHNMNNVCKQCDDGSFDEKQEIERRRKFFERHKKLTLLAICKEKDLYKLLPANEVEDMKNTLRRIQTGEEKSALVDCVLNDVPRFFHIVYAEYCAVEILADVLKGMQHDSMDQMRFSLVWDFVVHVFLYSCSKSVRSAFDYKLQHDPQLADLAATDQCKSIIFKLLLKETAETSGNCSPLQAAVDSGMNNFVKVLLLSIETNLKEENVKLFLNMMRGLDIFGLILNMLGENAPTNFTNFFTHMNLDRVVDALKAEDTVKVPLAALSLFLDKKYVEGARNALNNARQRIVEKAADKFGLSEENVELLKRLAETIKRLHDNR